MLNKKLMAVCLTSALTLSCLAGCANSSSTETTTTAADQTTTAAGESTTAATDTTTASTESSSAIELTPVDPMSISYNDYVDVSAWKDAVVTKDDITEPEGTINYSLIVKLVKTYGFEMEDSKETIDYGDIANIDFAGYIDGEALEGGSDEGYELEIGSNSFINGFEEGLIGAKAGDKVTLDLEFPDPYPNNPDIAGKSVTFEVTINSVQRLDISKITDEDFKEKSSDAYDTLDAFVTEFKEDRAKSYKEDAIWQAVMQDKVTSKAVCEELADDFTNTYLYTFEQYAAYFGMTLNEYLAYYGYSSSDEFVEAIRDSAESYAKQTCAVLAIAEMEKIEIAEDKIDEEYATALKDYEDEAAAESAGLTRNGIKFDLILDEVQALIYNTIEIQ